MLDETTNSDWKTDWIYQLVFREVEDAWQQCLHVRKRDSKVWRYVLVAETTSTFDSVCVGRTVRAWVRDESGLREIGLEEYEQHVKKIRGSIYPFILFTFNISENRQQVAISQREASRAGFGRNYLIEGEGEQAHLVVDAKGGWIS